MTKRLFLYLMSALFLSSCGGIDTQNDIYVQFYQSRPHDEKLFGWWKMIDQEEYYCFESENFNYLYACYISGEKLHIQGYDEYWYTSDGHIYIFQKGNWKIGMEEYQFEYFLAEDNNTIYTRQSGGEYTIWLQRSEAPDGVVD